MDDVRPAVVRVCRCVGRTCDTLSVVVYKYSTGTAKAVLSLSTVRQSRECTAIILCCCLLLLMMLAAAVFAV